MSYLGKKEIFTIALGSVIGWGAFILPGNVFLPNYGVLNTFIGFMIAIIMLVFIENSYSKVMTKVPESGGEYSFATTLLGKKSGFITGWGLLLAYLSIIPLNATAVPMVLDAIFPFYTQGKYLYSVSGFPVYLNDILVSVGIIVVFTFINIKGIKGALKTQNMLVFALIGSLILIVLISLFNIGEAQTASLDSNWGELNTSSIVRIIAFAPWAFIGFDAVAQLSGDHNLSSKSVSRITMMAIVIGAIIYNVLNVVTALGIPNESLTDAAWATGEAVKILVGKGIFYFLAVAMFGAVVSGLNGFFISSSRLIDTMSEDYDVGKRQGAVKTGNGTLPRWVIYFIGACAIIVPFFGRTALLWFVDLSSIGASVAYFMTCLCAYKIAETSKDIVFSCLGMLVSLAFLVFLLTPIFDSNISLPSYYSLAFWIAFGFVVFVYIKNRKQLI